MVSLTEFLLARIAEDEAVARAATEKDPAQARRIRWAEAQKEGTLKIGGSIMESMGWEFGGGSGVWQCDDPDDDCEEYRDIASREATHIARHDPARVLAECEAKRKVLFIHFQEPRPLYPGEPDPDLTECTGCGDEGICWTLRAVAIAYADHPDFRKAWRA